MSTGPFAVSPIYWKSRGDVGVRTGRFAASVAAPDERVSVGRLAAFLSFVDPSSSASFFDEIGRVPPDSTVEIDAQGKATVRPRVRSIAPLKVDPIEASRELWARVLASVERSVQGATRVAVLTGGGVDSSALLASAIAVSRGATHAEVDAITLDFAGDGDDRPYMRDLERAFGIVAVRVKPSDAGKQMRAMLDNPSVPMISPGAAGGALLLRHARERGADVALSGTGGDDLFDGYPRLLAEELVRGNLQTIPSAVRLRVPWSTTPLGRLSSFVVRPLLGRLVPTAVQRARRKRKHRAQSPWAGPRLIEFLEADASSWERLHLATPTQRFDFLAKATYIADAVEQYAQFSSMTGMCVAHPFLDEGLLELVSALPPPMLLHGGRLRGLFRLAARGSLPETVRLRENKASFALAYREVLDAGGGVAAFDDLATMTESANLGLVDASKFRAAFQAFPRAVIEDEIAWTHIWPALAMEGFLRARAQLATDHRAKQ